MQRLSVWFVGAALAAGVLLTTGCPLPAGHPIDVAPGYVAEYTALAASSPYALAASSGDGRVFYTEKNTGSIRVVKDGAVLDTPFATVPVNYAGDRGLLGIALHPAFAQNGRIYVCYTRSDTGDATNNPDAVIDQRIVYFTANGDVAASGEVFVASLPMGSGTTDIGGFMAFAPDGTLYVGFGDQTNIDAPQDPTNPLGKILRYNDDGTIPANNPSAGSAVYASGVRDPAGMGFDPLGALGWFLDREPNGTTEINSIQFNANYGWPEVVGFAGSANQDFVNATPNYADPLLVPGIVLSGVSINPSAKYGPATEGGLFSGAAATGEIYSFGLTSARTGIASTARVAHALPTPITDVGFTPAGTLYVASETAVLRINRFDPPQPPPSYTTTPSGG